MEFFTVILAGGSGTRFWPLSRKKVPKQFLPVISEKTMIEETVHRLTPLIPESKIFTISNADQAQVIRTLLPNLPGQNILVEPQGKNTAPSLMLATAEVYLNNPSAVVAALPADHLITDTALFLKKLEAGAETASKETDLVTFGIPPTFPATGYGYIQFLRENPVHIQEEDFYSVLGFKEKPEYEQAIFFMREGNYYWNSGMFLWKAETFAAKLEQYAPSLYAFWLNMCDALKDRDKERLARIFEDIPSISIDYALMEKAEGVRMCEGNFGWSDVGSWTALHEIWGDDEQGNACRGENILLDTHNCQVYNPGRLTAMIGIKDIIVVNSKNALLICHKDQDQRVKQVVERLEKKDKKEFL
ncbi:MAG: mannose-1-phosphate guanylyltransferase [Candidatus Aminicenantes bacterium]|jgi:mannose-1-phosphate guanylyltransferase